MTPQSNIENRDHDYLWELLPWYVNEGLSRDEVSEVEAHLKDCPACQSEVSRCRDVSQTVKSNQREIWMPSAQHFATLLDSVDAFEAKRSKAQDSLPWLARWFPWFSQTPRPVRFTLALQGALVVALATTLLVRGSVPTESYRTLSQPDEHPQLNGQQVRLVFSDDLTEKELREMLLGVHGHIVAGPSPLGVYTIALEAANASAQVTPETLAKLRAHPKVRLAEMAHRTGE